MYVKLFEQILSSSIAENYKTRLVFEDMLLLADKNGIVDMTHEALARRTNVPIGIIKVAIIELEQPDPRSRRADQEGRRIIRIDDHRDWGWHIVNFEYYRNIKDDHDRTAYMREYIKNYRKKADVNTCKQSVNKCKHGLATIGHEDEDSDSEAESEAEAYKDFCVFWQLYPRKIDKKKAQRAWDKAKRPDIASIIHCLDTQIRSNQWTKNNGEFIPHPTTWINNERWNYRDTPAPAPKQPAIKKTTGDAINEIVSKLEESDLAGGDSVGRCMTKCNDQYNRAEVNEAYSIFKFRKARATK